MVERFAPTIDHMIIRNQGPMGNVRGALSSPWNPFTKKLVRRIVEKEQPDIMHVHNTVPLISPSVFYAASGSGTATVMTESFAARKPLASAMGIVL